MTPTNSTNSALRQAIKRSASSTPKISSNFTYLTMLKVNKLSKEMEHKRERRSLIWTIIIAVFMFLSGVTVLGIKYGMGIVRAFTDMGEATAESFSGETWTFSPFLIIFMLSILILLIGDHFMRRVYLKRHAPHKED